MSEGLGEVTGLLLKNSYSIPGGWGTWVNVCWVCAAGLSEPYHIIVTFYLCIYLINPLKRSLKNELTQFLKWIKTTLLFTLLLNLINNNFLIFLTENRPILNLYLPKDLRPHSGNSRKCDPIIVTPVVKMRPHPAAHPHYPLVREYPPPGLDLVLVLKSKAVLKSQTLKSSPLYLNC